MEWIRISAARTIVYLTQVFTSAGTTVAPGAISAPADAVPAFSILFSLKGSSTIGYGTRVLACRYRSRAPSDPRGSAYPLRGTWLWLGKPQFRNVQRGELQGEEEAGLEAEHLPFDKALLASDAGGAGIVVKV